MMASSDTASEFKSYIHQYIHDHECYGTNGFGDKNVEFVPLVALEEFWTERKIVSVLCRTLHEERIRGDVPEIKRNYLVVFSILVYISKPEFITSFLSTQTKLGDLELPFEGIPMEWTHDDRNGPVMEVFQKNQWRFCPLSLDRRHYKSTMNAYRIIPISNKRPLDLDADEEEDVVVYEAYWHAECLGSLPSPKLVLKEYRTTNETNDEVTELFENELDIYTNLNEAAFEHIVRYYGSFEQQGKITLVLEHASGGNLVEFWADNPPPTTPEGKIELWDSFFQLLLGLEATHNLVQADESEGNTGQWLLKGIHQDIRPQNILVTGREPGTYRLFLKLTDFGTGHVRRCRNQGVDPMGHQRKGNGMYSAPEAYRDNNISRPQLCECDIWSLGAVGSELLVWSIRGERKRRTYQSRRCEATGETHLVGGYHEGSFHNGEIRLPVVDEEHKNIDVNDVVSRAVSRIILGHMLIADVAHRSNAALTYEQWTQCLAYLHHQAGRPGSRRDTRDSYHSLKSSLSKRQSVNSVYSKGPSFTPSFYSEPAQTSFFTEPSTGLPGPWGSQSQRDSSRHEIGHGKHVEISKDTRPGEGPSGLHQGETILPRGKRRDTRDSASYRTSVIYIPEMGRPETNMPLAARHASTLPIRSAVVTPPHRTATASSMRPFPPSTSPSALYSRRTSADEFHSVEAFAESSRHTGSAGLGIESTSGAKEHLPSPPSTPPNRSNPHSSSRPGGSATAGLEREQSSRSERVPPTPGLESVPSPSGLEAATASGTADATSSNAPIITINVVFEKILFAEQAKSIFSLRKATRQDILPHFPILQAAVKKLKGLNGREQIFIIDDSISMLIHRRDMGMTLRVLARLLKEGGVDPDKSFTMYYACKLGSVSQKRSKGLQNDILKHEFAEEACHFGVQLDEIVTDIFSKTTNPVSIYVLTNGRWNAKRGNPTDLCKVDSVIERILNHNKNHSRQHNHVGFQFIRFFHSVNDIDDTEGLKRLKVLDDGLGEQFKKLGIQKSDIVDTTDWNGDVGKMLKGGVFEEDDNPTGQ